MASPFAAIFAELEVQDVREEVRSRSRDLEEKGYASDHGEQSHTSFDQVENECSTETLDARWSSSLKS